MQRKSPLESRISGLCQSPKLFCSNPGIQGTSPLESSMTGLSQRDPNCPKWKTSSLSPSLRTHGSEDISTHSALVEITDGVFVGEIFCKLRSHEISVVQERQQSPSRIGPQRTSIRFKSYRLSDCEVHERYSQELCCLFNMFHYDKIDAKKLDAALKSLKEKYYEWMTDRCRTIRRGDLAGTSLSRPSSLEGAGNPSTSLYPPGTNACGGGVSGGIGFVNNNGDPCSSVKHSPPGKGRAPYEQGAGNPSTSGYPPGTHAYEEGSGNPSTNMNAPREWDLEMGRVNDNNGDPPAPGDVPSSVVPHVAHTANRSGGDGLYVAITVFSAAASRTATTTMFANSSNIIGVVGSVFAILLADTNRKAATPILAKAGIFACAVGLLADIGKDLPLPLFTGAIIAAIFIITVAMVFAKRLA